MMSLFNNEEGYSLVESLVALALLSAVLVPLAMFLIFIGGNTLAKDKIQSFNHARNELEWIIATESDSSYVKQVDGRWWVKSTVTQKKNLYTITVEAFKEDTSLVPNITLETARLWYK